MATAATELLTAQEVADLFRVSKTTVHRWGRTGILPMVVAGNSRRFHRADVERLLAPAAPEAEAS